jgi:recombination protein RecT
MANEISTIIQGQRETFISVRSDPSIEFEREASFAMQILSANGYLMDTAMKNKPSIVAAITNVAAIGISLNPASKLAYLVPRKGGVCLDISYMGMMHLAQVSGAIKWGQAVIVRATDDFELRGIDQPPHHKFNPFNAERGDIIGAYVVVKTDNDDYLTTAMPISKIYDIRNRSEAWKAYESKGTKCPWVTDEEEMIKKTVVKNASKYWPRRDRLDGAIHHMNIEGEEGLVMEEKEVAGETVQAPRNITPRAGAMESLKLDTQTILREIADDVKALMGNPEEAYEFLQQQIESNELSEHAEAKVALWDLFNSRERSALTKVRNAHKEAA